MTVEEKIKQYTSRELEGNKLYKQHIASMAICYHEAGNLSGLDRFPEYEQKFILRLLHLVESPVVS